MRNPMSAVLQDTANALSVGGAIAKLIVFLFRVMVVMFYFVRGFFIGAIKMPFLWFMCGFMLRNLKNPILEVAKWTIAIAVVLVLLGVI